MCSIVITYARQAFHIMFLGAVYVNYRNTKYSIENALYMQYSTCNTIVIAFLFWNTQTSCSADCHSLVQRKSPEGKFQ